MRLADLMTSAGFMSADTTMSADNQWSYDISWFMTSVDHKLINSLLSINFTVEKIFKWHNEMMTPPTPFNL